MAVLLGLLLGLLVGHLVCNRLVRREGTRMMRPADEWDGEDVERWLALIEPFPLPRPTPGRKS